MRYVRSAITRMSAYIPGEQPKEEGWVKLNQNECSYPPSPAVAAAITEVLDKIRIYPEPSNLVIREAAAEVYDVAPEQVMAVNGSDEMLRILCQACAADGETIVTFTPGFTFYKTLAQVQGARFIEIEMSDEYQLPALPDLSAPARGLRL